MDLYKLTASFKTRHYGGGEIVLREGEACVCVSPAFDGVMSSGISLRK